MNFKFTKYILDDWLSRIAGLILFLILVLTLFVMFSQFPEEHPLLGVFIFGMVPLLFILGGIVFVLAIFKYV